MPSRRSGKRTTSRSGRPVERQHPGLRRPDRTRLPARAQHNNPTAERPRVPRSNSGDIRLRGDIHVSIRHRSLGGHRWYHWHQRRDSCSLLRSITSSAQRDMAAANPVHPALTRTSIRRSTGASQRTVTRPSRHPYGFLRLPVRPSYRLLGRCGYVGDYPVEWMMRDAKIAQIYEGSYRAPGRGDVAKRSGDRNHTAGRGSRPLGRCMAEAQVGGRSGGRIQLPSARRSL